MTSVWVISYCLYHSATTSRLIAHSSVWSGLIKNLTVSSSPSRSLRSQSVKFLKVEWEGWALSNQVPVWVQNTDTLATLRVWFQIWLFDKDMRYAKRLGLAQLTLNHLLVRLLEAQAVEGTSHDVLGISWLLFTSYVLLCQNCAYSLCFALVFCLLSLKVFVKNMLLIFYKWVNRQ